MVDLPVTTVAEWLRLSRAEVETETGADVCHSHLITALLSSVKWTSRMVITGGVVNGTPRFVWGFVPNQCLYRLMFQNHHRVFHISWTINAALNFLASTVIWWWFRVGVPFTWFLVVHRFCIRLSESCHELRSTALLNAHVPRWVNM